MLPYQQPFLDLGGRRVLGRSVAILLAREALCRASEDEGSSSLGAIVGKRLAGSLEGRPRLPCICGRVDRHQGTIRQGQRGQSQDASRSTDK